MSFNADRMTFSMGSSVRSSSIHNADRSVFSTKNAQHYANTHNASMLGRKVTYHYLTITGIRGSTTNRGSIPANAIVEAIIAT